MKFYVRQLLQCSTLSTNGFQQLPNLASPDGPYSFGVHTAFLKRDEEVSQPKWQIWRNQISRYLKPLLQKQTWGFRLRKAYLSLGWNWRSLPEGCSFVLFVLMLSAASVRLSSLMVLKSFPISYRTWIAVRCCGCPSPIIFFHSSCSFPPLLPSLYCTFYFLLLFSYFLLYFSSSYFLASPLSSSPCSPGWGLLPPLSAKSSDDTASDREGSAFVYYIYSFAFCTMACFK